MNSYKIGGLCSNCGGGSKTLNINYKKIYIELELYECGCMSDDYSNYNSLNIPIDNKNNWQTIIEYWLIINKISEHFDFDVILSDISLSDDL